MSLVKLGLWKKPIPTIIEMCLGIVVGMTGNVNFATPNPALADVSLAIKTLSDAYIKASDGGRSLKAAQRKALAALMKIMSQLAAYVQATSGGDETIILSSAMGVRNKRSKRALTIPENLRTKENNNAGEISLLWKAVKGKSSYLVQITLTPETETSWVLIATCTKNSITIKGLESGKLYWVRVAALGANGQSGWSEPAQKMVR